MSPSVLVFSWSSGCHGNNYDSSSQQTQFSLLAYSLVTVASKKKKKIRSKLIFCCSISPSENLKARGPRWWRDTSFLDMPLFECADRSLLCPPTSTPTPTAAEMRQSIIKHGDDREEVIWVEVVGSREGEMHRMLFASCVVQGSLSLVSHDCACL